ncbi:GNAT family N-acetyltransferase [Ulvibacterium marinum]|uniref:GNAT family N-acetyltransferase n=1 Tax=Ulvibacterium marinum TaxID=2419782 RepID=A0A3B0CD74_9FLAO|nr:GNAT family N-acetyltransferase [Ulvibacterium marinum]RKN82771.1 GNAT family N-acetyltransferase [Ulvibacterium marinum]
MITLRDLHKNDLKLLFDWANNFTVRKNALNKQEIKWEHHQVWFKKKMNAANSHIFILEDETVSIGQIRFDRINENLFEIDYSIDENYRGKGYGSKIIQLGITKFYQHEESTAILRGLVQEDNIASSKTFLKSSFMEVGSEVINELRYIIYEYRLVAKTYVILSSQKWNAELVFSLKRKFPHYNFVEIIDRKDFLLQNLEKIKPHTVFIPHWSYIIPQEIFTKYECIVFHMTDLPYGRGGSPLQNLIVQGKKSTKISALKVVQEIDAGPIFLKKKMNLLGTAEEIFIRANTIVENMIFEIIAHGLQPKDQQGVPFFFKRRTPEMSKIDTKLDTIEALYDQIRMLDADGYPNAYLETEFFKYEFTRASLKTGEKIIADVRIIKK